MLNPVAGEAGAAANAAALVPETRRSAFLPKLFGKRLVLIGENTVYNFMGWLCPDYLGGFWNFYEHADKPLYLAPTSALRYRIICRTNGYDDEVSADAGGIIATLFAFSHLSFRYRVEELSEGFHRLRDFAGDHPEAAQIFAAID